MARNEKTGRRASEEDRARAAGLVASYFRGRSSPDSRYCINPEDEPEFQIFTEEADVETLIVALQRFADHGTFALVDAGQPIFMRWEFSALRSDGMTYEKAVAELAAKHNMSESSVSRRLRGTVKT